jgi:hypothetical protein
MKLPALAIAAAFVCGIVLGLCPPLASRAVAHVFLVDGFVVTGFFILAGVLLTGLERPVLSAAASMLSWILLGVLSAGIAQQPLPPDHIVTLVDDGRVDIHTPLTWHGRLRDEPVRLPWGYGYEVELAGVEYQNTLLHARGGMRLASHRILVKKRSRTSMRETRLWF